MWPTEILQGNLLWRATLATTSSVAYFFFLQKTGYYPLKNSQRIWQHIAATAFLQYSFYALGIDQKISSILGAEVDTAIAYVQEKNPKPLELTTTQKVIAFFVGKERFTTYLREEDSKEIKTQMLCERLLLRKKIIAHPFTTEDQPPSTMREVAEYALFGIATIASTLIFQNTYPHLSTVGRAARYVISNIWLDLAIDASGGESPAQSPAQIIDLADIDICPSLSSAEKRRRVAFYAKEIESLPLPIEFTDEMNTLIEHAKKLDEANNMLPQTLAQDIYSRLNSANTVVDLALIPKKIRELATLLPDKAPALHKLIKKTEIHNLFERRTRIATNLQSILNVKGNPSSLPWYTNPLKKTPTPSPAILLENKEVDEALDELRVKISLRENIFNKAKKEFLANHDPSEKTLKQSKKIEELAQEVATNKKKKPISLLHTCFKNPRYNLIEKLPPKIKEDIDKQITDKSKITNAEKVKIKEALQKYLPESIGAELQAILAQEEISYEEINELQKLSQQLIKYYPDHEALNNLVPENIPTEDIQKDALIAEIKGKIHDLKFPEYNGPDYDSLKNSITYTKIRIAEIKAQNSPFKLDKILSASLSVLSILNRTSYLDFFKMTIPLKEVSIFSRENIGDITIRTIFNYCVKKL